MALRVSVYLLLETVLLIFNHKWWSFCFWWYCLRPDQFQTITLLNLFFKTFNTDALFERIPGNLFNTEQAGQTQDMRHLQSKPYQNDHANDHHRCAMFTFHALKCWTSPHRCNRPYHIRYKAQLGLGTCESIIHHDIDEEKNLAFNYTVGCIEYCCAIALLSLSFCVATLA